MISGVSGVASYKQLQKLINVTKVFDMNPEASVLRELAMVKVHATPGNRSEVIGLANIFGGLGAGWLAQRYRMKRLLFWMYASRAVMVGLYLVAPKTDLTFYVFAFGLGLTWLATVPPTAGIVGKLFGVRYLGTLFGLTLLSHQIGGFLGAWLGGLAITRFGDYTWMWWADIVLALLAAVVNLPIREAKVRPAMAAA